MAPLKRWRELVPPGVHHHLAIIHFALGRQSLLHTHDFPEVFWLETGTGCHWINGQRRRLDAGDLVLVRPEDEHRLEAVDSFGFTLINLAYAPDVRRHLLERYAPELRGLLASKSALPCRIQLSSGAGFALRRQVESLRPLGASGTLPSTLGLEHFLLGLHGLTLPATATALPAMPDWLRQACLQVQRPEVFVRGASGLVRAAGRSAEHVARTMRAVFGQTPSDYVNGVRMDYAARQLRTTSRPIADIALDCGLNNLSHFYARFRAAHGQTPRGYRLAHERIVA